VAAALAVTLSLGAAWGTLLLVEVGRRGSLTAIPAAQVVAHGEAQFWGFVAPFIIGVAATFLPRTTARPRPRRVLLDLLLGALLAGVLGGFVWSLAPRRWPWLGTVGGLAQVAAALGFLALAVQQLAGKLRTPWARFVLAAAAWMIRWAVVDLMFRGRAGPAGPGTYTESARGLLIELELFGFALNAVYGFGQRLLPGMLGGGAPRRGAVEATFGLHNAGVLALVVSHVRWPGLCAALGAAAIAAGAWAIGLQSFRTKRRSPPRPEAGPVFLARYIQLALFWLLTALALFAANVFRTLWPRRDPLLRTGRATLTTRVAVLLAEHPWLEDHLVAWGLRYIGRVRSVPAELTLGSLAVGEGFDPETTVARINVLLGGTTAPGKHDGSDAVVSSSQ